MLYKIHRLMDGKLVGQNTAKTLDMAIDKAQLWVYVNEGHNRALVYQVNKGKTRLIKVYWHDLIRVQSIDY